MKCSIGPCEKEANRVVVRLCEKHYMRQRRHGSNLVHGRPGDIGIRDAFALFSTVRPGEGCWPWQGVKQSHGYGVINLDGQQIYAHRASYEIANGVQPAALHVLHHCDNPPCVRPDHLFLGTQADNNADMYRKGRGPDMRGSRGGRAILIECDVYYIRSALQAAEKPKMVAQQYGVNVNTIYNIKHRRSWRHI